MKFSGTCAPGWSGWSLRVAVVGVWAKSFKLVAVAAVRARKRRRSMDFMGRSIPQGLKPLL